MRTPEDSAGNRPSRSRHHGLSVRFPPFREVTPYSGALPIATSRRVLGTHSRGPRVTLEDDALWGPLRAIAEGLGHQVCNHLQDRGKVYFG
jgi:hypothetical protein